MIKTSFCKICGKRITTCYDTKDAPPDIVICLECEEKNK